MNELTRYFIKEYKQEQECKKLHKKNCIEFNDYFKYSGETEPTKVLISHWRYNHNHRCNDIHEKFIKLKEYEKNKKNADRLSKSFNAYYWDKTTDSIWSDKV
tara:strand:+ start:513 stop:818 length:306 start_codon:yes stop_codon:yes gene_type:complete